ncbi:cytochrome P450 [Spongiibacter sp. IMCC21906]|uniref:cytochrome P450 n=1 Tax=Spongiibacter sp. IMCC21906 TaxID=1620392 RepID=UPI00062DD46B|nr:cytochrome P450 [Spongiibacter sp. IMCC21906]AKH70331.1 cytochrome P450 [Spongiibacter sp. IMCC21906]
MNSETLKSVEPVVPEDIARIVVSGKSYAHDDVIYPAFKWLRGNMPLGKAYLDEYDPIWLVTKYDDVMEISRDADTYKNGIHNVLLQTRESDEFTRKMMNGKIRSLNSLAFMDAHEHKTYRDITAKWFMPNLIKRYEQRIREIAKESVDEFFALGGECDFVKDFALYYPLRVIMDLIGIPREDEAIMLKLTQELFAGEDPDERREGVDLGPDAVARAWHATMMEFYDYFRGLSAERQKNPKDDLISLIANHRVDGERIDEAHEFDYYIAVATAGHDTTSTAASGGVLGLIQYPEQFDLLKSDIGLVDKFVTESIRWTTPIKHFMRTASRDVELRGQLIHKNDRLMLCYPSANRDPDRFTDPDAFVIDRRPNQHLAFGNGLHMCLGQHLARLDMRILFQELIPRLNSIELTGTPKFIEATFTSGLKTMPVRYTGG